MSDDKTKLTFLDWIGVNRFSDMPKPRWLGGLIGFALSILVVTLIITAAATLLDFLRAVLGLSPYENDADGSAIRNIGLVLAALIGAPFVIWRSYVAAKQANLQDEALFNDKINAASTDLAARRQVTRIALADGAETILTEWQDDLVTRAAAIDRLEGLAHERPLETPRIARMLSVYVRELSREYPPEDTALDLTPARSDMEKAAQTLGRLKTVKGISADDVPIDLRDANLQGFDLKGLTFDKALLQSANLQSANLSWAQLRGVYLSEVQIDEFSSLDFAILEGAALRGINLTKVAQITAHLDNVFGDTSVKLPEGVEMPAHWIDEESNTLIFRIKWVSWLQSIGGTPDG